MVECRDVQNPQPRGRAVSSRCLSFRPRATRICIWQSRSRELFNSNAALAFSRADGRGRLLNCHVYGPGEARFLHGVRCDGLRNHESGDLILVPQTSLARRGAISRQFARSPGSKAFDSTYRAGGLLGQNAMATNHLQCEPSLQLPLGLCLRPSLWLRVRLEDKPGPQPTSPARFLLLTRGFWPTSSDSS